MKALIKKDVSSEALLKKIKTYAKARELTAEEIKFVAGGGGGDYNDYGRGGVSFGSWGSGRESGGDQGGSNGSCGGRGGSAGMCMGGN